MIKAIGLYFKNNFFAPLAGHLRQDLTPERMAFTLAISLVVGMIPVWGAVTAISFLAAYMFRLNLPAMMLITTAITPLQIMGYIPFIEIGTTIFGDSTVDFSFAELTTLIQSDFLKAMQQMGYANLLGVFAWLVLAFPTALLVYYISLPIFRKLTYINRNTSLGLE